MGWVSPTGCPAVTPAVGVVVQATHSTVPVLRSTPYSSTLTLAWLARVTR